MHLNASKREKLRSYSIRLREDQMSFLKSQPDPAEFLRGALDRAISEAEKTPETPEDQIIGLTKQVELVQAQIKALDEDPEFQEAEKTLMNLPELTEDFDDKKVRLTEALERGMKRAESEGISVEEMESDYDREIFKCYWKTDEHGRDSYIIGKAEIERHLKSIEKERVELEAKIPYLQQIQTAFKAKIKNLRDQRDQLVSKIESIEVQRS